MRDPQRIQKIQSLINAIWLTYPDMRYFQLLSSIKVIHNDLNKRGEGADCFYEEDDKLEATLLHILSKGFRS